ncbi:MAG: ABC transporter permease [Endomicrobiia bacterium]|jgi:phospholipid/cholesterol/gamma-HCH transport system permease protein|nr:ABC transporter permease [Endomicrobiaceae bacterium]MDD3053778.1 ABC transporter permease [Endomicrobiaceae bacterium]MDD3922783.1 ABC transporter permease [Endomicrobiaceae bacterium]
MINKTKIIIKKNASKPFSMIGYTIKDYIKGVGHATQITAETLLCIFKGQINIKNTVIQMVEVGYKSFPIIMLTSFFTGMVLALQVGSATSGLFNEPVYIGMITGFALVKELGPVLTAVVITGRVGAAITAEIGTMKVTEQIDALYTLGTNPVKYLAVPRFLACILMLPLLTALANIIGIYGGLVVTTMTWDIPSTVYMGDILNVMDVKTFWHGFIKSFFFAAILVIVACHKGFKCSGGAEGVGKATTSSVMVSMILILISDYFLTDLLVSLKIS